MSIKVAQNDLPRKMKVLKPLQKLPKNVGKLGKISVATVVQSAINCPIWSHWWPDTIMRTLTVFHFDSCFCVKPTQRDQIWRNFATLVNL